jgi:hypothetical protein
VSAIDTAELMRRYGRAKADDTTPRTVFVEATLPVSPPTAETPQAH